MHCSIVIPVLNEADNIVPLLEEISFVMGQQDRFEVIYVDDHSTDRTYEILQHCQGLFPWLEVFRLSRQSGQSAALYYGVVKSRYPLIVTLDGDGQNDPADIMRFVDEYRQKAEVMSSSSPSCLLIGHREQRNDTWWRQFSSYVARIVRRWILGDDTPDSGCGMKVFSKETYLLLPHFNHMHRFLSTLVKQRGGIVISLNANHRKRLAGKSHYGTLDRLFVGLADVAGVLWLGRRAIKPNCHQKDQ